MYPSQSPPDYYLNPPYDDEQFNGAPPQDGLLVDFDAERAVLGSCLIDPDAYFGVSNHVIPGDFFRFSHQVIYEALEHLYDDQRPADFITVVDEIERMKKLQEIGGPAILTDLVASTPTALYADHYAKIVFDRAQRRNIVGRLSHMATDCYNLAMPIDEVIGRAHGYLDDIGKRDGGSGVRMLSELMQDSVETIDRTWRNQDEGTPLGLSFGLPGLDAMLGRVLGGDFMVIAGRPGMGKSLLALQLALSVARNGDPVGVCSLEMSEQQLIERLLTNQSGVSGLATGRFDGDHWTTILEAANDLGKLPIWIADNDALSLGKIRAIARRENRRGRLKMLVVDYMQLMDSDDPRGAHNRNVFIGSISRGLKRLARQLDILVVGLSQLSRGVDNRLDHRPQLADLRESGDIEADADQVLFPYYEPYYNDDSERLNIMDLILAKNRHGRGGTTSAYYQRELFRLSPLEVHRTPVDPYVAEEEGITVVRY